MNKKITSSVLAALMVAGSTSFTAFAAMTNGTVVIGTKAFDLNYANDATHAAEIGAAIVAGGAVYVKDFTGKWINNTTGATVDASVIPAVTYKSATGVVTNFAVGDKDAVSTVAVSSVSAITKTGVSVKLTALTKDMDAQTIIVKDNNGNIVAVNPLNLVINETVGNFVFKTALTADPVGVWTVEGIQVDTDLVSKLAKINSATTEIALYNALVASGVSNLTVENSPAYLSTDKLVDGFKTLAEVQLFVNTVNSDALTGTQQTAKVEALVKLVAVGTPSQVQVLSALKASWININSDFIGDYVTGLTTPTIISDTTPFKDIQTRINAVNVTAAGDLVDAAKDSAIRADYTKALTALSFVREDDTKDINDTVKADLKADLAELNLVINVKEATTAAQFANSYNALVIGVNDKAVIGTEVFYTGLRTQYMALTNVAATIVVDASGIEAAIIAANDVKQGLLFDDVAAIIATAGTTQTTTAVVLTRLQALAAYVDVDTFDISDVVTTTTRLEAYRTALAGISGSAATVQTAINTVNSTAVSGPLGVISSIVAPTDAALLTALKNVELTLGNVVDANVATYQKDLSAIKSAATSVATLKVVIGDLNQVVNINNATTASQVNTALLALSNNDAYINVPSADRVYVANLVFEARNAIVAGAGVTAKVFANLGAVETSLGTNAGLYVDSLELVNGIVGLAHANPSTISDVVTALSFDADYADMTSAEKATIAENFLTGLVFNDLGTIKTPFRTLAAVKVAAGL